MNKDLKKNLILYNNWFNYRSIYINQPIYITNAKEKKIQKKILKKWYLTAKKTEIKLSKA